MKRVHLGGVETSVFGPPVAWHFIVYVGVSSTKENIFVRVDLVFEGVPRELLFE